MFSSREGIVRVPQVRLSVDGAPDVEVRLWQWLQAAPGLRGQVRREQMPADVEAMGGASELVVALASTGTLTVLARTVGVWLTHRHSDVTVTVTLPDGAKVALDARRVQAGDVERLLQATQGGTIPSPQTSADTSPDVSPPAAS